MIKQVHRAFYFLVPGLFLLMASSSLFTHGMFMDGVIYATVARNMAEGLGSFWAPQFTDTLFREFFEHPPLALGLESMLFQLFGDHLLVERIYSLLSMALLVIVITMLWRRISIGDEKSYAWLPLVLFLPLPLIVWATSNNMLENTMTMFTSLSILFMVKSTSQKHFLNLLLASFWLVCAFFTKGPVALFPLSFFFWMTLFMKDYPLKRFVGDTIYTLFFFAGLTALLFFIFPESLVNLQHYFQNQVVKSLESVLTVNTRFHIVERLIMEFLPAIIVAMLLFVFVRPVRDTKTTTGWKYVLLGLGLSASLPIMVSLKQRGFYIIPALPVLALALSVMILPRVVLLTERIARKKRLTRVLVVSGYFLVTAAVALNLTQVGKPGRDTELLRDVQVLTKRLPPHTVISATSELTADYALCAYLYRYGYLSLERNPEERHEYLLLPALTEAAEFQDFEVVDIPLQSHTLLRLRQPETLLGD